MTTEITHKVTRPWQPVKLLDIPSQLKDPNFVYRGCNTNALGNIRKKEAEGWEIDKELSKKMKQTQRTVLDGNGLDGTLQIRELLIMRMPKEIAESRAKYYADKSNEAIISAKDHYKAEVGDMKVYGDIDINKGGIQ